MGFSTTVFLKNWACLIKLLPQRGFKTQLSIFNFPFINRLGKTLTNRGYYPPPELEVALRAGLERIKVVSVLARQFSLLSGRFVCLILTAISFNLNIQIHILMLIISYLLFIFLVFLFTNAFWPILLQKFTKTASNPIFKAVLILFDY